MIENKIKAGNSNHSSVNSGVFKIYQIVEGGRIDSSFGPFTSEN